MSPENLTTENTEGTEIAERGVIRHIIRHIIRGCGNLPHCGEHPGTFYLLGFVAMGAIAGARGGVIGVVAGIGLMLSFLGPIYLSGAYARSKAEDKRNSVRSDRASSASVVRMGGSK